MSKFQFSSSSVPATKFTGHLFYSIYKNAEFLRTSTNIETILSKGYQLRHKLKDVPNGESIVIEGMSLERNTELVVKKTGPNVIVEDYEFTYNRLCGLVAAYAFENRENFPIIKSSEAETLGLIWDNEDTEKCKMYLSAVTGAEHFYDQFYFYPLVCALRKLHLKKITKEPVMKIAKIKNKDGVRMATDLLNNYKYTEVKLWRRFPRSNSLELKSLIAGFPKDVTAMFSGLSTSPR